MTFDGAALRRLREAAGLTQAQLAEQSGVSVRTIRRLETEPFDPLASTVTDLSRVLGPGALEQLLHE